MTEHIIVEDDAVDPDITHADEVAAPTKVADPVAVCACAHRATLIAAVSAKKTQNRRSTFLTTATTRQRR